MRRCVLCGGIEGVHPIVFSADARVLFEDEFPETDLESQLVDSGLCADCIALPMEIRTRLFETAHRRVVNGAAPLLH